jgi:hypothetical protein
VNARLGAVQEEVRALLSERPHFAQLITVDGAGSPVTRTVGAQLGPDGTVEMVVRAGHARLRQLAANPRLQLVFVGPPRSQEPVARPAVIDYGLPAPRVVALSGSAEPMSPTETVRCYRRQTDQARERGHHRAPERTDAEVRAELAGVRMRVTKIRAEGFDAEALALTWAVDEGSPS